MLGQTERFSVDLRCGGLRAERSPTYVANVCSASPFESWLKCSAFQSGLGTSCAANWANFLSGSDHRFIPHSIMTFCCSNSRVSSIALTRSRMPAPPRLLRQLPCGQSQLLDCRRQEHTLSFIVLRRPAGPNLPVRHSLAPHPRRSVAGLCNRNVRSIAKRKGERKILPPLKRLSSASSLERALSC